MISDRLIAIDAPQPDMAGRRQRTNRGEWLAWQGGPWLFGLALSVAILIAPKSWIDFLGPWFFLSSVLVFGLSHGASDVWLARKLSVGQRRPWSAPRFVAVYVAVMGLVVVAWTLAMPVAFALFLLLTAWHWGSAETVPAARHNGPAIAAQSMARGTWVILAPFAWHFDNVMVLTAAWGLQTPDAGAMTWWLNSGSCAALWWLAVGVDLGLAGRNLGTRAVSPGTWGYRTEVFLLGLAAAVLPPFWWIGMYFMAFHAWRHGLRLARLHDGRSPRALATGTDSPWQWSRMAFRQLMLDHWGYWIAAGLLLVPLGGWWHGQLAPGVVPWTGTYLMWLAALTVPHALLVRRLDRYETAVDRSTR